MKVFRSLLLLAFALHCLAATEKQEINGAFGLKLGDVFDVDTATRIVENTSTYYFAPKIPNESFQDYYVLVAAKTKRIFCIGARSLGRDKAQCEQEQQVLLRALREKYGEGENPPPVNGYPIRDQIKEGSRKVEVLCKNTYKEVYCLEIHYLDSELALSAKQEKQDQADENMRKGVKKLDKSGL